MPIPAATLEQTLKVAFPDAEIEIVDLVGDQDHYSATITSSAFVGKSRVAQHRMVHDALEDSLGSSLHALQLKTLEK